MNTEELLLSNKNYLRKYTICQQLLAIKTLYSKQLSKRLKTTTWEQVYAKILQEIMSICNKRQAIIKKIHKEKDRDVLVLYNFMKDIRNVVTKLHLHFTIK